MAQFHVTGPDGQKYEVNAPDDASEADVMAYVQKNAQAPISQAQAQEPQIQPQDTSPAAIQQNILNATPGKPTLDELKPISTLGRFAHGVAEPFFQGARLIANSPFGNPTTAQTMADMKTRGDAIYNERRKMSGDTGIDLARGVGNIVGSAPIALAVPGAGPGQSFLGATGRGIAQGAALGATQPIEDANKPFWGQVGSNIGTGAATGGATAALLNRAGAFINPEVSDNVKLLRERGVNPTPGQILGGGRAEDAFSHINPAVGFGQERALKEYNVAVYNEVVKPWAEATGKTVSYDGPAGSKGIKAVGDMLSDAYNTLKDKISLPITPEVQSSLADVAAESSVPMKDVGDQVLSLINKEVMGRVDDAGVLSGKAFKDVEEALTKKATRYARGTGAERDLAEGIYDSLDVLREALAAGNPEHTAELQALNKSWAMLTRIESAVSSSSEGGVFTPAQLLRATETGDQTIRHRAFARGEALLQPFAEAGKEVLGGKYPNSGTAGRLAATAVGTGLMGGAAAISPAAAIGLGASTLPYTPWGQRAAGWALASPKFGAASPAIRNSLQALSPVAASGLIFGARPNGR